MIVLKENKNYRLIRETRIAAIGTFIKVYYEYKIQIKKKFIFNYYVTYVNHHCNNNEEERKFNDLNMVALFDTVNDINNGKF